MGGRGGYVLATLAACLIACTACGRDGRLGVALHVHTETTVEAPPTSLVDLVYNFVKYYDCRSRSDRTGRNRSRHCSANRYLRTRSGHGATSAESIHHNATTDMRASRKHQRPKRLVDHDRPSRPPWSRHVDPRPPRRRNWRLRTRNEQRPERRVHR
jgi:hypothetical protein